jgi:hypothetical protein
LRADRCMDATVSEYQRLIYESYVENDVGGFGDEEIKYLKIGNGY